MPGISAGTIASIAARRVLDSHCEWTNEFILTLDCGAQGRATSPRGETLSPLERAFAEQHTPEQIVEFFNNVPALQAADNQVSLDEVLLSHSSALGKNVTLALSLAYLDATCNRTKQQPHAVMRDVFDLEEPKDRQLPRPLFNVLNGGRYASTNPVLSDFHEYLLVPMQDGLEEQLGAMRQVSRVVRERLAKLPTVRVGDCWVHRGEIVDNRIWFDLLLDVLQQLGFEGLFGLMVDAAAEQLLVADKYELPMTRSGRLDVDAYHRLWERLATEYPILLLEDPFAGSHPAAWIALNRALPQTGLVGDDLCESDAERISACAQRGMISACMIKPNKSGTVSETVRAIGQARLCETDAIPSHRSIETECTWLADLCYLYSPRWAKLGLLSDFETVIKLNRLIRYHDDLPCDGPSAV